jgi:electron transfer flavoprotein beta subunit
MQIYVCVKHVPDTAANIKVTEPTAFDDQTCKFVVNPYDEYAVEEAVQRVEKEGSGEVVIVTVGKEAALDSVRGALAMGAHRGILVKIDSQFLDSSLIARALKAAIEQDGAPDIIFTGKGAVDTEGYQTQYRLAEAMNLPVVNEVTDLNIENGAAVVEREIGGGAREILEMALPGIIGTTKGLNEPRYPKFPDIMKAKKKEVKQTDLAQLGIGEQVSELVRILKDEEKVLDI